MLSRDLHARVKRVQSTRERIFGFFFQLYLPRVFRLVSNILSRNKLDSDRCHSVVESGTTRAEDSWARSFVHFILEKILHPSLFAIPSLVLPTQCSEKLLCDLLDIHRCLSQEFEFFTLFAEDSPEIRSFRSVFDTLSYICAEV